MKSTLLRGLFSTCLTLAASSIGLSESAFAATNASIQRIQLAFEGGCTAASPTLFGMTGTWTNDTDDGGGTDLVRLYITDGAGTVIAVNSGQAKDGTVGLITSVNAFMLMGATPARAPYTGYIVDEPSGPVSNASYAAGDTINPADPKIIATSDLDLNALDPDCPGGGVADVTPPTVAITGVPQNFTGGTTSTVTFTWSEPVIGFAAGDIVVTGGSLSGLAGGPTTWTATLTVTGTTDVTIAVGANAVTDGAGNPNGAAGATGTYAAQQVAEEQTEAFIGESSGSILSLQPDLRTRLGINTSPGVTRGGHFVAQMTKEFGIVSLDTGDGPVWMALQAEKRENAGRESMFGLATFGMQWQSSEHSATGAMIQLDFGRGDTAAGGHTSGRGFMIGPYIVRDIGGVILDARLMAGRSLTDVSLPAGATASDILGSRLMATAQLTGRHELNNGHAVEPRVSLSYIRQTMDAFTIGAAPVAAQENTLGEAVVGGDWEIPLQANNGVAALTLGFGAHYAFQQTGGAPQLPTSVRGRLDIGVRYTSDSGRLFFEAEVYTDGIGAASHMAYGAALTLNYRF